MNIRQIYSVTRRRAAGVLAALAATAVAVAGSGDVSAQQTGQRSGMLNFLDGNTPIIQASAVRTAADVGPSPWGNVTSNSNAGGVQLGGGGLAPGTIAQAVGTVAGDPDLALGVQQVGHACSSCSQPSCNGGCNSCGTGSMHGSRFGSRFGSSYGAAAYGARSNACGVPCNPYYYANIEGLYFRRQSGNNFTHIRNEPLDESQWEWVPRLTIGRVPDCVNGYEVSFTGVMDLDRETILHDPNNGINSLYQPGAPGDIYFDPDWAEPFQNSSYQRQYYGTEYWSGEVSKTLVGWDVIKMLCGARYISLEELYQLDAISMYGGRVQHHTRNQLFGGQVGMDLLYPTGRYCYTDVRARAGLYYNWADGDALLFHQGELVQAAAAEDSDFAGAFEFGSGLRFHLGEMLSIRIGGELWYITGVATAEKQVERVLTSSYGRGLDGGDDIFFIGMTVGAEFKF